MTGHAGEDKAAKAERIVADMRRARGRDIGDIWKWAAERDPDFMEHYADFSNTSWDPDYPRQLEPKTRELIVIVVLANRGFHWSLPGHVRRALDLGATPNEILEALEAAVIPGGTPILNLGLQALVEVVGWPDTDPDPSG